MVSKALKNDVPGYKESWEYLNTMAEKTFVFIFFIVFSSFLVILPKQF